jgi:hypothetical protein
LVCDRGREAGEDCHFANPIRDGVEERSAGGLGSRGSSNRSVEAVKDRAAQRDSRSPDDAAETDQERSDKGDDESEEREKERSDTKPIEKPTDRLQEPLQMGPHAEIDHRRAM